ncbi:MAG: RNA ligase family protein [Cyanobacteria bacterium P01_A01_bin.45]
MSNTRDWKFTSYEKIEESSTRWQLDESAYRLLDKSTWVVTEKIHGANFCFVTDGEIIRCANRKKFLEPQESFFNYQVLLEKLKNNLKAAFLITQKKFTQERLPQISHLFIYGELFGGSYPHPDVKPDKTVQPIQTGIYYSPSIEFCAFDIAVTSNENSNNFSRTYLDYHQAIEILQAANIFYAKPLLISSFTDANNFPIEFTSTIPQQLNLPPLPEENQAEGIVIKPLKALYIETPKGKIRPIIKHKTSTFAEDKRFHQSVKWSDTRLYVSQDELEILRWEAFNLITENRLQNAISKIGYRNQTVNKKIREKSKSRELFNLVLQDVLEELAQKQPQLWQKRSSVQQQSIKLFIENEIQKLLKNYFQQESRRV